MRKARLVATACCLATLAACASDATPTPPPTPSVSPAAPTTVGTPTPALDLTRPGAARTALTRLLTAAGADRVLMVSLTRTDAAVTILRNGAAETWALRGGDPRRVESDTTYVSQATFDVAAFDLSDLGALFRTATAVAGSDQRQELQIVDYSAGLVMMTVSTNPESRTVFFNPDASLLPTLDFESAWGLRRGYADAVGVRGAVHAIGFGSPQGVYADVPGPQAGTVIRRQRTARVPVVVSTRSDANPSPLFDPAAVDAGVVWQVVEAQGRLGRWAPGQEWSCVADARDRAEPPRLRFQVGTERFVTDLAGHRVDG